MNKSKKFSKINEDIEQEVSDDMSNGNSKEEEDLYERPKKKHKQKSKPSKSRKKKKSNKRKKHRHVCESGTGSSSSAVSNTSKSSITSRSSESDVTKKRKKRKFNSDEDRVIKIKSEVTKEPSEKFCSKWESPPRKRQRSHDRLRDESRDHYRSCRDDRERQEKCVHGEYRSEKARESQHYGRQQRSRSPRRSHEKSYDRHYIKRENYSPTSRSRDQSHIYQTKSKREVEKTYDWGKSSEGRKPSNSRKEVIEDKEKPNFALSGALTEDTNKVNGVVIKYSEPPEARKPKRRWRLYPFKGETALPVLHIHRQSCFLVGRDRKIADLAVDHPSCSKQHAALQYRLIPFIREDGSTGKRVRLYLIDLDSANGTFVNNKPIEARKYYELFEKDVIKFGFSTREYVLLHENSKEDQEDDDILLTDEQPSK
uniref:FHA domain-containing protein n=1 Tax=Glossina pallidipes TaxID=7398 RepID=A0A1A9ZGL3_GLOPL